MQSYHVFSGRTRNRWQTAPMTTAGFEQKLMVSNRVKSSVLFLILFRSEFLNLPLLTLGMDNSLLWGVVLYIIGCLAAYLASTHKMTVANPSPNCDNQKRLPRHCQMCPGRQSGPQLRTSALALTRSIISPTEKITAFSSLKISYSELS